MFPSNAISAVALLFIAGMAFLRTRLHYRRGPRRRLRLTVAGVAFFAVLFVLLASGWWLAPRLSGSDPFQATLGRVMWFLTGYFLSIPAHRLLAAAGAAVFKPAVGDIQGEL